MDIKVFNQLLKKLKKGKQEYFGKFYDLTKKSVYYSILSIVGRREDAEDVMQDTYVAFIQGLANMTESRNGYYYLLQIAKNKAINHYNRAKREVLTEDFSRYESGEQLNVYRDLDYLKSRLTEEEWYYVEHCVILGFKQKEIAKMLDLPTSTVGYKYNKVIDKARKIYEEVR